MKRTEQEQRVKVLTDCRWCYGDTEPPCEICDPMDV